MGFVSEFKQFAMRGNVVDLAVGVVIGGAFGKIVSSVVADVIMPPVGLATGGVDFRGIKVTLQEASAASPAVTLNIGNFLQAVVEFGIIAFAVFLLVKAVNALARKEAEKPEAAPAVPTNEEKLLMEIRDLLKPKN